MRNKNIRQQNSRVLCIRDFKEEETKQIMNKKQFDYIHDFDIFSDDIGLDIKYQKAKLVTTRAPHLCTCPIGRCHTIEAGSFVRYEEILEGGKWSRYWTCLDCIDEYNFPLITDEMTFEEYQDTVMQYAIYPNVGSNIIYPALGLSGEAGEVAEKIKKVLRDKQGVVTDDTREALIKELGDVLFYVTAMAYELQSNLREVASINVDKIFNRVFCGTLKGSGDDR